MMNFDPKQIYLGFPSPATPVAAGIIDLHDYIIFYIIIILILVFGIYIDLILQNLEIFRFPYKFLTWFGLGSSIHLRRLYLKLNKLNHLTILEIIWTIIPSFILLAIAIPSLALLYSMDEVFHPHTTVKIIGYQWYWSYEVGDKWLSNYFHHNHRFTVGIKFDRDGDPVFAVADPQDFTFDEFMEHHTYHSSDSYMLDESELWDPLNEEMRPRLLAVDDELVLPCGVPIRVLVTGADVLHSWAVPAFGIKIDAVPGRLNQGALYLIEDGKFYGQCSELCGVNHAFMPIVVKVGDWIDWYEWVNDHYPEWRDTIGYDDLGHDYASHDFYHFWLHPNEKFRPFKLLKIFT